MPNATSILKEEVARLRAETATLRKQAARDRSELEDLKERLSGLESKLPVARPNGNGHGARSRNGARKPEAEGDGRGKSRYSARSLAAQRKRLGLSAAALGKLFGVSAQSVYNWESKRTRPREKQLAAFMALRQMDRNQVASILAQG
jgi:DNA-binding transcriptional regulator YiaG